MRKTRFILFVLAFMMFGVMNAEIASGTCGKDGDNITWVLDDDGTLTLSGSGEMEDYNEDLYFDNDFDTFMYYVNTPWYSNREKIIKISISDGITSIGDGAFYKFSSLTSVTIPNSVTRIGNYAFNACSGLTSVTIGNSVMSIDKSVFSDCNNVKELIYADGCKEVIRTYLTSITSVTIPNSVASIRNEVFQGCTNVKELIYADGCKEVIRTYLTSITSVTIPNSVTSIGSSAFSGCSGLTSVTIPNSVTSIGSSAFSGCSGLTSVTIPNSVTSIGWGAFSGCSGLTSVTIPNSVTSIGWGAFERSTGLTSVTIGNSVTSIGNGSFSGCSGLTSFQVDASNPNYCAEDNVLFNKDKTELIYCVGTKAGAYIIPNSVTSIGQYAFIDCNNIKELIYADECKEVLRTGLTSITSVTIPNSVVGIGNSAFYGCSGLTYVTIPNSVTSIGTNAFYDCTNIREIHSNSITPPSASSFTFSGVKTANCKLYVPTGSKEDYAFADGWSNFVNIIEEEVTNTDSSIEPPTIAFENKKLTFHSSTPNVKYIYKIKAEDNTASLVEADGAEVELTATYIITAYAKTKSATSEASIATLVWVDAQLTSDSPTDVQEVKARPILVSSNGGNVTIKGLEDNEKVDVYSLSGTKLNSVKSAFGTASFSADKGSALIVKIGDRSVKVVVK